MLEFEKGTKTGFRFVRSRSLYDYIIHYTLYIFCKLVSKLILLSRDFNHKCYVQKNVEPQKKAV